MNVFVACTLEIIYFMQGQTRKITKFVYNDKILRINSRILEKTLGKGCHLNTCNRNSTHFIKFPGGSNP